MAVLCGALQQRPLSSVENGCCRAGPRTGALLLSSRGRMRKERARRPASSRAVRAMGAVERLEPWCPSSIKALRWGPGIESPTRLSTPVGESARVTHSQSLAWSLLQGLTPGRRSVPSSCSLLFIKKVLWGCKVTQRRKLESSVRIWVAELTFWKSFIYRYLY